jgi:hypothetical protein
MMKRVWILLLILVAVTGFSGLGHASLTTIGTATYGGQDYKLIYESDQQLVWLDYTKTADSWQNQLDWASTLGVSLSVTLNLGYTTNIDWSTGWRLPVTDESKANLSGDFGWAGPDGTGYHNYLVGYNMVNSEMGKLYYESLGNKGLYATDGTNPQPGYGLLNKGDFENLQPDQYWLGTEYSLDPSRAWRYNSNFGYQGQDNMGESFLALAVRPGEVSSIQSPVPVPAAVWLFGSGLIGLAGIRKRFSKNR